MENLDKILIETGDVVELKQPYKFNNFKRNSFFVAALNNGFLPETSIEKHQIYENWLSFYSWCGQPNCL